MDDINQVVMLASDGLKGSRNEDGITEETKREQYAGTREVYGRNY